MKRARKTASKAMRRAVAAQPIPDLQETVLRAAERTDLPGCRNMGPAAEDGSCRRCGSPAGGKCEWEKRR